MTEQDDSAVNQTVEVDSYEFMYCPNCDRKVAPEWVDEAENFLCAKCDSQLYEDKEEYIDCLHAAVVWQKEHGYGPLGKRA